MLSGGVREGLDGNGSRGSCCGLLGGAGLLGCLCGRRLLRGGAARTPGTQPWPPQPPTYPWVARRGGIPVQPTTPAEIPAPSRHPPNRHLHPPNHPAALGVEGCPPCPEPAAVSGGLLPPDPRCARRARRVAAPPGVRRPTPQSPWVADARPGACLVCHAWCAWCTGWGACCVWSRPPSPRLPPLVGAARTPGIQPCPCPCPLVLTRCTPGGVRRARNPGPWGRGLGGGGVRGLRPLRPAALVLGAFTGVWSWGRGVSLVDRGCAWCSCGRCRGRAWVVGAGAGGTRSGTS